MDLGINLGGVNNWTPDSPFIDKMLLAGAQRVTKTGSGAPVGPVDAITGMNAAAGIVVRQIPIDPGAHSWVILTDDAVSSVYVLGNGMRPVSPQNGRATVSTNDQWTGADTQVTITAKGPVKKFSIVRADQESAFLAGELFNPEFLDKIAPFPVLRLLDWNSTNYEFGAGGHAPFPAVRPSAADGYFTTEKGGMPAEVSGRLAARTGKKLWFTIHHLMPDAMVLDTLRALDATAGASEIDLEWSNEFGWNYHRPFATQATKDQGYGIDWRRYYGYRSGKLALLAAQVSKRFKVNLCDQMNQGSGVTLKSILAGWDDAKAPRNLIAGSAVAPYINMNRLGKDPLLQLYRANDTEGFYKFAEARRDERLPWLAGFAAMNAAEGIPSKAYESRVSLYTQAPNMTNDERPGFLAWAEPLLHSDRMAEIEMVNVRAIQAAGFVESCTFQLSGKGGQSGFWGVVPHVSQPGYPIYDRLVKMAKPDPYSALAARVADMQRQLAALAGDIAAAAVG